VKRCAVLLLILFGRSAFAQTGNNLPVLQGLVAGSKQFTVFATVNGSGVTTLSAIGQQVGPYELTAVDVAQGYADFKKEGKVTRVWLGEGHTKALARTSPGDFVRIPLPKLSAIKRVNVLGGLNIKESRALKSADAALDHELNDPKLSLKERQKILAQWLSGERAFTMIGSKPISDDEGRAAGFTPEQIAQMNQMSHITPAYFKKTSGN
jgi:hypothetical protein